MAIMKNSDLANIAFDVKWGSTASGYDAEFAFGYTLEDAKTMNSMSRGDYMEAITHLALNDRDLAERREWYDEKGGFADIDWVKEWRETIKSFAESPCCECSSFGIILEDGTVINPDDSGFICGIVVDTTAECAECGNKFTIKADSELNGSWAID